MRPGTQVVAIALMLVANVAIAAQRERTRSAAQRQFRKPPPLTAEHVRAKLQEQALTDAPYRDIGVFSRSASVTVKHEHGPRDTWWGSYRVTGGTGDSMTVPMQLLLPSASEQKAAGIHQAWLSAHTTYQLEVMHEDRTTTPVGKVPAQGLVTEHLAEVPLKRGRNVLVIRTAYRRPPGVSDQSWKAFLAKGDYMWENWVVELLWGKPRKDDNFFLTRLSNLSVEAKEP